MNDDPGMDKSEEFAVEIFDSLARRRGITAQVLTKDELRDFWEQLSDPGFDAKLRTFFDLYVFILTPSHKFLYLY